MSKEVQIGPFTFSINRNPPEDDMGGLDFDTLTLSYTDDPKYNPQLHAETLLHELLHAAIYLTPYHAVFTTDEEEHLVRSLSPYLLQAIQQLQKELAPQPKKS